MWQIYFNNELAYIVPHCHLYVDLHIGETSGRIVGLSIWDKSFIRFERKKRCQRLTGLPWTT